MSTVATPDPRPAPPPAKPRKRRRWLKRLAALVVALGVVLIAVQAFLWSDYPRRIGINVAQRVTGLRVEIDTLTITWSGSTRIDGLRVSLPLAAEPFLTVPSVRARHTPLWMVPLALGVAIDGIEIDSPDVTVLQAADGTWNLQHVLAQVAPPGKNASAGGPATLPGVTLTDARVHVRTRDGRSLDLADVALVGRRDNALAYRFDGRCADLATVSGEISASGRWPHRATVVAKSKLLNAVKPIVDVPSIVTVASATLEWAGERTDTGVVGRLTVPPKTTLVGPIAASGQAVVRVSGADVTVEPADFTVVVLGKPDVPAVTLAGGAARLSGSTVTLDGLRVRLADGSMRLTGGGDLTKRSGAVTASWEQIAFPAGVVHTGTATVEAADIWPGRPWVRGDVQLRGRAAGNNFETHALIAGDGPSWADATYVCDLPLVRYGRRSEVRLSNVRATLHNTAEAVELVGVRTGQTAAGPATLITRGRYAFAGTDAGSGYFSAVGDKFRFANQDDLFFNVNAWLDPRSVVLENAHVRLGAQAKANLSGKVVFNDPEPVQMQLDFETQPALSLQVGRNLNVSGQAGGKLRVGGQLGGDKAVTVRGTLSSEGLKVNEFDIGNADLAVSGSVLGDRADVATDRLTAFGGTGRFGASFEFFSEQVQAWTSFEDIDLARLGTAVGVGDLTGTAAGQFELVVPTGDFRQVSGDGKITVTRPAFGTLVGAKSLDIPVLLGAGYVKLQPVATQEKGGRADAQAMVSLDDLTNFKLNVTLADWLTRLPMAEFSVLTSGRVDLPQFSLAARAATGSLNVRNRFFAHDKPIGDARVELTAKGRQVMLQSVSGNVLGGTVYGVGSVDFRDLAAGEMWAGVQGLSLDRLAQIDPRLTGVEGRVTATLHTHAATTIAPLGPVQADVNVTSDRATYKGIEIGDSRLRVFLDRDRVALADEAKDPNYVSLAGGTARVWARLSRVPGEAGGVSAYASVHLENVDTEQLNRMYDPDGKPVPGRLGGDVVVFGGVADIKRVSGQGTLSLTRSDLGNIGPIAALYNIMNVNFSPTPAGEGTVDFRISEGKLNVVGMNYFNRGVYARGAISIDDVLNPKDSHISGYLLGTFRPLKDLDLPLLGTVDGILDALQSSATTIRVDGTMEKPNPAPASLKQVGGDLKKILIGDAKK